jgi:hypothetical protein
MIVAGEVGTFASGTLTEGAAREVNMHGCSTTHDALSVDATAALVNDSVRGRQAESGSCTDLFGGEGRLEDAVEYLRGHADTVVGNAQSHQCGARVVLGGEAPCGDRDLASGGHRVSRVAKQIQQDLTHLSVVGQHHLEIRAQVDRDPDVVAEQARHHLRGVSDDVVQIEGPHLGSLLAADRQELARQPGCTVRRPLDHGGAWMPAVLGVWGLQQQFDVSQDDRQQIVEVVRHTAGQTSDGLHLLHLLEPCLGLASFAVLASQLFVCRGQRLGALVYPPCQFIVVDLSLPLEGFFCRDVSQNHRHAGHGAVRAA